MEPKTPTMKVEVTVKCCTPKEAAEALRAIAYQLQFSGFDGAPNDIREYGDGTGYHYETMPNDGTDIYGNTKERPTGG